MERALAVPSARGVVTGLRIVDSQPQVIAKHSGAKAAQARIVDANLSPAGGSCRDRRGARLGMVLNRHHPPTAVVGLTSGDTSWTSKVAAHVQYAPGERRSPSAGRSGTHAALRSAVDGQRLHAPAKFRYVGCTRRPSQAITDGIGIEFGYTPCYIGSRPKGSISVHCWQRREIV